MKESCDHCGDALGGQSVLEGDKNFCCSGCAMVYKIIQDNGLDTYYQMNQKPGSKPEIETGKWNFLKDDEIQESILVFKNEEFSIVRFFIPQIHCSSCVWLLERLYKINPFIRQSKVNFLSRTVEITYLHKKLNLAELAALLDQFGYEPELKLSSNNEKKTFFHYQKLLLQTGVAGFCFGNIMLLSFPEYLKENWFVSEGLFVYFNYLIIMLATPVLLFSAKDYFVLAFQSIKNKVLDINIPIVLGISVLYLRSLFEILVMHSAGFLDSMTGFVFFLLLGKWIQIRTFDQLQFDKTVQYFISLSAWKREGDKTFTIPTNRVKKGDVLLIRHFDIIPVDGILDSESASIDYSFLTGESEAVCKTKGEQLYAGGKLISGSIEMVTQKPINESEMAEIWNLNNQDIEHISVLQKISIVVSKYFIISILIIAFIGGIVWYNIDASRSFEIVTSILIVACPCALALSIPVILGSSLKWLSQLGFHIKSTEALEKLEAIDEIIFDKTGTLTTPLYNECEFQGIQDLAAFEKQYIAIGCNLSKHPLSQSISKYLTEDLVEQSELISFEEIPGEGITFSDGANQFKLGAQQYVTKENVAVSNNDGSFVFLSINGAYKGCFVLKNNARPGIHTMISALKKKFNISLLTGDHKDSISTWNEIFDHKAKHNQTAKDKLEFIEKINNEGQFPLMIGDGLNDAGALQAAHFGCSVIENSSSFNPASDGILEGNRLQYMNHFLHYAKRLKPVIIGAFIISLIYNLIGLGFALYGYLTPLVAAILMPISSLTVVLYGVVVTYLLSKTIPSPDK